MKNKFMAAAAVMAVLTATGVARADDSAEIRAIKAQSEALKKQNAALEARLNKLEKQQAVQAKTLAQAPAGQPAPTSFLGADLSGIKGPAGCALPSLDGPLTFCGITFFGTIDAGLGYASNGLPINSKLYLGDALNSKFAHGSYFGVNPNGLSVSTLGVKGAVEILPGVSGVFMASTNINPQSGQLANAAGSIIDNNGLNRNSYSNLGDGSRGGQAFNDQLYVGLASPQYGQLTFGRHRTFTTDLVGAYDPTGGASNYSLIGYSGTYVGGLGNTENGRWDDSFKYRVEFPSYNGFNGRFGAMYKFADGNGGSNVGNVGTTITANTIGVPAQNYATHNDAGQLALGGSYGGLDVDGVLGYYHQAVVASTPLSAAQLGGTSTFTSNTFIKNVALGTTTTGNNNTNTLSATASDNTGGAIGAKYTWEQFKLFAGWSHFIQHNPSDNVGIGAQNDQGGYTVSSITNGAFPHARLVDTEWVGVKYAYNPQTDFTVAWNHAGQNSYGWAPGTLINGTAVAVTNSASLASCGLPAYVSNVNGVTINGVKYAYQSSPRSSTCSGTINTVSGYVDYHFNKRFDVYGGIMYSVMSGGLASGFYNVNNFAPTVGARFTF